jgi:hypothetical protein
VFSGAERDALRDHVLRLGNEDGRVVAGAAVGSLAVGSGDRFSDLDLTFAVADDVPVAGVLDDWTRELGEECDALHLLDLAKPHGGRSPAAAGAGRPGPPRLTGDARVVSARAGPG